ncbi:MAG: HEPN domain-containing protein [candidate division Zixibacteria bacterium]|nr:HEPN domain-containing protein [candidate division Zixibacteria bacterium]
MTKDKDIPDLLQIAKESLEVAEDLFKSRHYGFSASRSYYAMFYAVEAVLLTKNLSFSKHKAVISAFGKEFIKTDLLPQPLHQYLRNAFKLRQLGDYGFPGAVSEKKAWTLIEQTRDFIETIEEYLRKEEYEL